MQYAASLQVEVRNFISLLEMDNDHSPHTLGNNMRYIVKVLIASILIGTMPLAANAGLKAVATNTAATSDIIIPNINSTNSAGSNVALIQSALNSGGNINVKCNVTAASETDTIPASPFIQVVANSGVYYTGDSGVKFSGGAALTKVASGPTTGQYSVTNTGAYTFAAANAGRSVIISYNWLAPTWLNGHLTINSNTRLASDSSCHFEQVANTNDNLLVNAAYLAPWNTQYINSGTIATGPLAMIWQGNTPAWAATTSYAKGNYVISNGNIYWENAATCTSAGSGGPSGNSGTSTGPTGTTGAAIADNTCSWYYVTTNNMLNSAALSATVYYPNSGLTINGYVKISPQPDNGSSRQWTGSQTAHTRGGPCDSAYFGTFFVTAVNDSNYITVQLMRLPGAAFSGIPMDMKSADHDIIVSGGLWDSNFSNNNAPSDIKQYSPIIFSSIANLQTDHLYPVNTIGYGVEVDGANNFDVGFTKSPGSTSADIIKIYGSFNGVIHDTQMNNPGQGEVSIQTDEPTAFANQIISSQDLLNIRVNNTTGTGASVSVYPGDSNLFMDQIIVDGINLSTSPNENLSFSYFNMSGTPSGPAPNVGSIVVKNVIASGLTGAPNFSLFMTIQNLEMDNIESSYAGPGTVQSSALIQMGDTNLIVRNFTVNDMRFTAFNTNDQAFFITATIDNMVINGGYFNAINGGAGFGVYDNGGTITNFSDTGSRWSNIGVPFNQRGSNSSHVSFLNNYFLNTSTVFDIRGGTSNSEYLAGNVISGVTFGIARFDGTGTINLSSGGNVLSGGSAWWAFAVGTDTASSYGWDILCDVTKMTRTTGEYCSNTNAAPGSGTLTTVGPVMDQGTGANSWFAMFSPILQTY